MNIQNAAIKTLRKGYVTLQPPDFSAKMNVVRTTCLAQLYVKLIFSPFPPPKKKKKGGTDAGGLI